MNNDKVKDFIKKQVLEYIKVEEESSTGGEGYLGKTAYNPNKKAQGTAHNYLKSKMGWKEAPSIPNRPSEMIDYQQLFEDDNELETIQDEETGDPIIRHKITDKDKETIKKAQALIAKEKELQKENYSRFKNETKTRSKSEHYHKAILEVKKRTNELNKLLEYAIRLKQELNQVDEIKSSRHTLNALDKVTENIKEVYIKAKKLK